jgi:hypothetical protein
VTLGNYLRTKAPSAKNAPSQAICRRRLQLAALLLLLIFSISAPAQKAVPGKASAQSVQATESTVKYAGAVYASGDRRDPFLSTPRPKKSAKPATAEDEEISRGLPPPGIAGTYIAQAKLEGISEGTGRRVAVVRGAESRAYFLKEGDRLFDGYLKSIQSDSIILVRETKMRSGKIITNEVSKRLRTP